MNTFQKTLTFLDHHVVIIDMISCVCMCTYMRENRDWVGIKTYHWGAEKINAVNYLSKPPPPNDEYYYEEDSYVVNEQTMGFRPNVQGSNQENWRQGQGNQGLNYGNYNREGNYVRDGNYNRDKHINRGNYGNRNDRNGPYVLPQNREVTSRDGGYSMRKLRI